MLAKDVTEIFLPPVPATLAIDVDFHPHEQLELPFYMLVGQLLSVLPDDGLTV